MDTFTIDVPDLTSFLADIAKAGGDATPLVDAAYMNAAGHIQETARALAPHDTGTLQRSIEIEPNLPLGIEVKVNEKYGAFVEYGTGLDGPLHHRIYPKNGRVMAWSSKGGGKIFARSTKGMKKRPFFWPAVDESTPYVFAQFDHVADRLLAELAGRS